MDTALHRKIKSMCYFPNDGSGHWILRGCRTVWVADVRSVHTTKRAAYAAFRGPVPGGKDVRAACGSPSCIAPDHAELCDARRMARPLSLPNQIAELAKSGGFKPPAPSTILPNDLTLYTVQLVKYLSSKGNPLAMIVAATGLSAQEVAKIRGGVYDKIVKRLVRKRSDRPGYTDARSAESPADISDDSLRGAVMVGTPPVEVERSSDVEGMTEEEAAWLGLVRRG